MEQEPGQNTTFISSCDLNRAPGAAKQATREGPVFITEHGEVRFVLMSLADYERRLGGRCPTLAEALGMPGPYVEFEPARLGDVDVPNGSQTGVGDAENNRRQR